MAAPDFGNMSAEDSYSSLYTGTAGILTTPCPTTDICTMFLQRATDLENKQHIGSIKTVLLVTDLWHLYCDLTEETLQYMMLIKM